jgi:hypothetical protein
MSTSTHDTKVWAQLAALTDAARAGLERMAPAECGVGFESFPSETCGPVTELMGRIVLQRTGLEAVYFCGEAHTSLRDPQSRAWLEVGGFIVDLTHDQFLSTGMSGWVFASSPWHTKFQRDEKRLCLQSSFCMQYPHQPYATMRAACDQVLPPSESSGV